jgi:hypothetical protein
MSVVRIIRGEFRNKPVVNKTFTLVRGFQTLKKGNYVTVKNEGQFPVAIDTVKVKVDNIGMIEFLSGENVADNTLAFKAQPKVTETDEQAMDRIANRFRVLDKMSAAAINGDIRAMIVTGPPGVGKSHGIMQQLEKATLFERVKRDGKQARYEIVKGTISGIGLFAKLYKFSDPKNILVFDDCDVWEDQDALNILKGALDSGKNRRISYNKDSRLLREEGVPNAFDFKGSIIFITNVDFDGRRSKKIQAHLDALQSRSHFIDLTIDTARDAMLRVRQVHRDADAGLFGDYGFSKEQEDSILDFMWDNKDKMREISMRMALKIADLVKVDSESWKDLAAATCMKR